jgi:hypothetical protein
MINKLDLSHRFQGQVRIGAEKGYLGVGGAGREMVRTAFLQENSFFGCQCPYTVAGEIDLCGETGRGIEPPIVPDDPGALHQLVFPGVDLSAVVDQHGGNPAHRIWASVDPNQIRTITDTGKLGGFACPPAARAVQELYADLLDEFLRKFVEDVGAMKRRTVAGWERAGAPFHLYVFASLNGAVGSTAMHVVDRMHGLLKPPFRVIFVPLLLADHGRVTDRAVAKSLQHAGLTEILQRSRGRHA